MSALDSPLEALAFNYVNFGILAVVNNLWTWIAVVTAAVSFWRIRATSGGAPSFPVKLGHRSVSFIQIASKREPESAYFDDSPNNRQPHVTAAPVEETTVTESKTETAVWSPLQCNDGATRGKFTVYYEEDGDGVRDYDGELMAVSGGKDGEVDGSGEWWERWGRVVKMRNGEDGWYRYVDLTVINGNVVRLWDENGVRNGGRLDLQREMCCGW